MTSSPPSSVLSTAVSIECSTECSNYQQGLRSLRDLTQHLTTRADDNHAPPVSRFPEGHSDVSTRFLGCQALVRFFALLRIKPHTPLLVRAPVNSFEFQPCDRTPQAGYLMRLLRHGTLSGPTPSIHRLRRGLPGYLILFAPHAFVLQRQLESSKPPSPLVFLPISTHSTATLGIPFTSPLLKNSSFNCSAQVEPVPFTADLPSRLRTLYTQ